MVEISRNTTTRKRQSMDLSNIPSHLQIHILNVTIEYLKEHFGRLTFDGRYYIEELFDQQNINVFADTIVDNCVDKFIRLEGIDTSSENIEIVRQNYFSDDVITNIREDVVKPLVDIWNTIIGEIQTRGEECCKGQNARGAKYFLTEELTYCTREEAINFMKNHISACYSQSSDWDRRQSYSPSNGSYDLYFLKFDEDGIRIMEHDEVELPENVRETFWEKFDEISQKEEDYKNGTRGINFALEYSPAKRYGFDFDEDDGSNYKSLAGELWSMMCVNEATHKMINKLEYCLSQLE